MNRLPRKAKVGRHHPRAVKVWRPGELPQLRALASTMGLPFDLVADGFNGTYSSARAALSEAAAGDGVPSCQ